MPKLGSLLAIILVFSLTGRASQAVLLKNEPSVADKQQKEVREKPVQPHQLVLPTPPAQNKSLMDAAPSRPRIVEDKIAAVPLKLTPLDLSHPPATEEIMTAGQLGGQLYPTRSLMDPERDQEVNLSFGAAMQEWNKHEYKKAVQLLQEHVDTYPDSPWKAEAVLHIGCDCQYNGKYSEAEKNFSSIIDELKDSDSYGAYRLANKATLRLAVLKVFQNNFRKAGELFSLLLATSDDWREKTYASHWLQRIAMMSGDKLAMLNCGTLALARILERDGRIEDARRVREVPAKELSGQSMSELQEIAASYGYEFNTLRIPVNELARVPLPAIVQLPARSESDSGHYWVLEHRAEDSLKLFDPQAGKWFTQRPEEFAKEWDGNIMVLAKSGVAFDPQYLLSGNDAGKTFGGCCGAPRAPENLGNPEPCKGSCCGGTGDVGGPDSDGDSDGGDGGGGCGNGSSGSYGESYGAPVWVVNNVNMNVFVTDIPMWYFNPIGPSMRISLSYNSQTSIAYHQPFGNKWQFNYASYLIVDTGGQVTIFMPDGRNDVYSPDGQGGYRGPIGIFNILTKVGENSYELRFCDGTIYEYRIPSRTNSLQPFLVKISDRFGQSLTLGYDNNVNLTTITDALGRTTTIAYNAKGEATNVLDPFGREAHFEYDASNNLTKITDMGGYWTSFSYDSNVNLTSMEDLKGKWEFYIEPADNTSMNPDNYPPPGDGMFANYRITVTNPLGGKEEYMYYGGCEELNGCSGISWYVSPRHYVPWENQEINNFRSGTPRVRYVTRAFAGMMGKIERIIYPDGGVEHFEYDSSTGMTGAYTDQHGHIVSYVRNSRGKVTSRLDAKNIGTTMGYAANQLDVTSITSGLGTIAFTYDGHRNVTSQTDRLGKTMTFTYNSFGKILTEANADGVVTSYVYYEPSHLSRYRLKEIRREGRALAQFTYDSIGRMHTSTDSAGFTRAFNYDALNRITSITFPDGKQQLITYTGYYPWLVEGYIDRGGNRTSFEYDALKRLVRKQYPDGSAIRFEYDADSNLTKLIDQNGTAHLLTYDSMNRIVRRSFADGKGDAFSYDVAGLLVRRANARGIITTYAYDNNHNITKISYSDGTPEVTYAYDDFDRFLTRTDGIGTYTFTYDANHRITSKNGPWANDTLIYGYDVLGRMIRIDQEGGETITYDYDPFWRLRQINAGTRSFLFGFDADGPSPLMRNQSRPNGNMTVFNYDLLNRLVKIEDRTGTQQSLSSFTYTYDAQDQIASETVMNGSAPPTYSTGLVSYQYNSLNQLLNIENPGRDFVYDNDGNMTKGYTPDGYQFSAVYDAANRLKSIDYVDGAALAHHIDYHYSGDDFIGRMIVDGVETRYVRNGFNVLQERDSANTVRRSFVWNPLARGGVGGLLEVIQNGQRFYPFYDGRGNVKGLLESTQSIIQRYEYDPFGLPTEIMGSIDQPFRFSTKSYDEKLGLSYYGYRFYMPLSGRWINRDPLMEGGGLNLYNFVAGNPVNLVDLFGLKPGDVYDTPDDAAKAAKDQMNPPSKKHGWEYGTYICKNKGGKYFYTKPKTDKKRHGYRFTKPSCGNPLYNLHTHGKKEGPGDEAYTPTDTGWFGLPGNEGMLGGYMASPSDTLYYYDAKTGEVRTVE